jgi:hypothetical protein
MSWKKRLAWTWLTFVSLITAVWLVYACVLGGIAVMYFLVPAIVFVLTLWSFEEIL